MYFKFLTMATFLTVPVSTAGVVSLPASGEIQSFPDPIERAVPELAVVKPGSGQGGEPPAFSATIPPVGRESDKRSFRNHRQGKFQGGKRSMNESVLAVPSDRISAGSADVSFDQVGIVQPVALVPIPVRTKSATAVAVPVPGQRRSEPKSDQALQAIAVDAQIASGRSPSSGLPAIGSVTDLRPGGQTDATRLSQLPDASALRYRTTARNAYKVYFPYSDDGIASLKGAAAHAGAITDSYKTTSDLGDRLLEDGYYSYPSTADNEAVEGSGSGNSEPVPDIPAPDLDTRSDQGEKANDL